MALDPESCDTCLAYLQSCRKGRYLDCRLFEHFALPLWRTLLRYGDFETDGSSLIIVEDYALEDSEDKNDRRNKDGNFKPWQLDGRVVESVHSGDRRRFAIFMSRLISRHATAAQSVIRCKVLV